MGFFRAEAFDPRDAARPQKIAVWLEHDYPSIAARAKRAKAVIYWSDETGVCNQDQIGRGYAPKGQTPILTQTGQKFSTSMIAAVSNRGLTRFKLYKVWLIRDPTPLAMAPPRGFGSDGGTPRLCRRFRGHLKMRGVMRADPGAAHSDLEGAPWLKRRNYFACPGPHLLA